MRAEAPAAMDAIAGHTEVATPTGTVSATERVLGTVELLEAIMLKCELLDLLCNVQRVCKTWNNVIRNSVLLQQKLFYKQTPTTGHSDTQHVNPLATQYLQLRKYACIEGARNGTYAARGGTYAANLDWMTFDKKYKKLLTKPEGLEKCSWEEMYPTSEPCGIYSAWSGQVVIGEKTRLGGVMKAAN